jgi:hypothetical protein
VLNDRTSTVSWLEPHGGAGLDPEEILADSNPVFYDVAEEYPYVYLAFDPAFSPQRMSSGLIARMQLPVFTDDPSRC